MADQQNPLEEPEQTVTPSSAHQLQPPAHPRLSDEDDEAAAADERTSPFPYAEGFDEWVADETAAPDVPQHRSEAGDPDS